MRKLAWAAPPLVLVLVFVVSLPSWLMLVISVGALVHAGWLIASSGNHEIEPSRIPLLESWHDAYDAAILSGLDPVAALHAADGSETNMERANRHIEGEKLAARLRTHERAYTSWPVSGGVSLEAYAAGIPVISYPDETERPIELDTPDRGKILLHPYDRSDELRSVQKQDHVVTVGDFERRPVGANGFITDRRIYETWYEGDQKMGQWRWERNF